MKNRNKFEFLNHKLIFLKLFHLSSCGKSNSDGNIIINTCKYET